jgi:hypothetical protein
MAMDGGNQQPPPSSRGPWWVAAAGGGGGIVAAILQDHALGWAIVIAFTVWLIHNVVIAWLGGAMAGTANRPTAPNASEETEPITGR